MEGAVGCVSLLSSSLHIFPFCCLLHEDGGLMVMRFCGLMWCGWVGLGVYAIGYDKATQPVQVSPRLVTKVTRPVTSIALTVRTPCLPSSLPFLSFFFIHATCVGELLTDMRSQDSAMACLLITKDVVLLWNDGLAKIKYVHPSSSSFPLSPTLHLSTPQNSN